ncbi:MAG TPA: hypothetical protein VNR18_02710 [Hyphomicrobiales bacterium]|nr:hypothetical protein [Hyphomicrobiales bacterium]
MDQLITALSNPDGMTNQQWMVVALILAMLVVIAFSAWRLFRSLLKPRRTSYTPNLHRARMIAESRERAAAKRAAEAAAPQVDESDEPPPPP